MCDDTATGETTFFNQNSGQTSPMKDGTTTGTVTRAAPDDPKTGRHEPVAWWDNCKARRPHAAGVITLQSFSLHLHVSGLSFCRRSTSIFDQVLIFPRPASATRVCSSLIRTSTATTPPSPARTPTATMTTVATASSAPRSATTGPIGTPSPGSTSLSSPGTSPCATSIRRTYAALV